MGILTYKGRDFYKDGKKHVVMAGAMHYFRIPNEYWYDRLLKLKECGFNTVETYTSWNLHEPEEGVFNFEGDLDIVKYIEIAKDLGLNVILRPGPYICAEWEFGGFPAWILKYDKMALRCYDETFFAKVERYYDQLLPRVRPYLASNGGNIIMLQVENEYGSYGDDKEYLRAVAAIYKKHGMDCMYFTSDGPCNSMFTGGTLDEYLAVANFGSKPEERLAVLKAYRPDQPLMCGEYWCGWFDHWFEQHHVRDAKEIADDFEGFFRVGDGASFSFYMFHGGTNFGFMNGANHGDVYEPTVTSYDYCSPLNEAGDRTPTYYAVRDVVKKYTGIETTLTATETKKAAYGKVALTEKADLFENLDNISKCVRTPAPQFMEDLGQNYGYILYRTKLNGPRDYRSLTIEKIRDRAQIFHNGELKATYCRWAEPTKEEKFCFGVERGETVALDILAENMGRVNYGAHIRDQKGINGVRFSGQYHFGWDTYCLPMGDELDKLEYKAVDGAPVNKPTFFKGTLEIEGEPADTFIRLDGFHKGFVKVNGFNLGRYFNDAGPQKTLFVPAPKLRSGKNEIVVFESDGTDTFSVEFFAEPDLGDTTPTNK